MRVPNGTAGANINGVSCTSARACTAVGASYYRNDVQVKGLAEFWNGTTWRMQTVPALRVGQLLAVSCTSAKACTAVGYLSKAGTPKAVAERWNGSAWHTQTFRHPVEQSELSGVSCSTARACTAVGFQLGTTSGGYQPLAETWNGRTWRVHSAALPDGGMLKAVSCTSPGACTATGTNFAATAPTLAERWNGTRWRVQSTPDPASFQTSDDTSLDDVSCTSATACTASGEYSPGGPAAYFIEAWNGSTWRLVTAPVPAHFSSGSLAGISCVPGRCTAVGDWSTGVVAGNQVKWHTLALTN